MTIFSHDARALLEQVRLLREATNEMLHRQRRLQERIEQMPTREEIDQAKQEVKQAITDAANRVVATIQTLENELNAGNPVTDADLADLKSDVLALSQIAAVPPPPPTP